MALGPHKKEVYLNCPPPKRGIKYKWPLSHPHPVATPPPQNRRRLRVCVCTCRPSTITVGSADSYPSRLCAGLWLGTATSSPHQPTSRKEEACSANKGKNEPPRPRCPQEQEKGPGLGGGVGYVCARAMDGYPGGPTKKPRHPASREG